MTRTRATARKAGTAFERLIADYLRDAVDDRIDRRVKTGSKDRGDLAGVRIHGQRVVVECKDTAKVDLPGWSREAELERANDDALAGVIAHKRRGTAAPGKQWVSMELETFAALLTGSRDHIVEELRGTA